MFPCQVAKARGPSGRRRRSCRLIDQFTSSSEGSLAARWVPGEGLGDRHAPPHQGEASAGALASLFCWPNVFYLNANFDFSLGS